MIHTLSIFPPLSVQDPFNSKIFIIAIFSPTTSAATPFSPEVEKRNRSTSSRRRRTAVLLLLLLSPPLLHGILHSRERIYACSAQGPTAPGVTEGRSLPGDSTLVCAAYHQFPLILNRIQRTKPAPRRSADVYIGITGNVYTRIHTRTHARAREYTATATATASLHILNACARTRSLPPRLADNRNFDITRENPASVNTTTPRPPPPRWYP